MSPRTAEQFRELREESRERILQSALAVFARAGYERTTIRMIAQEAGVSQGLLYNYFSGKQELLLAIFERSMHDVQQSLSAAAPSADPAVQLAQVIRVSFAIVTRNMSFWKLSYSLRFQPGVLEGLGSELQRWNAAILDQLEALLSAVGSTQPAIEARLLFALIDGISQHYVLDPEHYPLDAAAEQLIARYARRQAS